MSLKCCSICGKEYEGFGNNAQPLADGDCCDNCNNKVIRERLKIASEHSDQIKL